MQTENSVITEASDIEEAIKKGLRSLNLTREQVEVEVLSKGKSGFLGLGSQNAKVKVSIKEQVLTDRELSDILIDLDIKDEAQRENYRPQIVDENLGYAEIKEGRVWVTNPVIEDGSFASIKPGKNVRLTVNGNISEDEVYVSEEDKIEIEVIDDKPFFELKLDLSLDKLEAFLRLVNKPGMKYRIKDQPPTNKLMILTEMEDIIELNPISEEDIEKFLEKNNITRGLDIEGIKQVISFPNSKESFVVARGQKPTESRDTEIRLPCLESDSSEEEGIFGKNKFVSVTPGDTVALRIPKQKGEDGWNVLGEVIPTREPLDHEITVKNGCELIENGQRVVSCINGRPVKEITGNKCLISVEPLLELKEVIQNTGNIRFSGDVEVKGDVREGCKIEAGGNIVVAGDVTGSTLRAGASVIVHKMIFGSTITAGGRAAVYSSVLTLLETIGQLLSNTYAVAMQLKNSQGFGTSDLKAKGDGPLIRLLLDSKFQALPKNVDALAKAVMESDQPLLDDLVSITARLKKNICGLGPIEIQNISELEDLSESIKKLTELLENFTRDADFIKARYVQNSSLMSSGEVLIEGQGCYISSINAGSQVIVSGKPGIARGVKIVSNGDVNLVELGSEFDTQTSVIVKENKKVSAQLIYPNVFIQVGSNKFRVDESYKNFFAYLNHEGRLTVEKLKATENPK